MDYSQLLEKVGSSQLTLSPPLQDLMQRVRENGLHKVAAPLNAMPEFTFKNVITKLGEQMCLSQLKHQKIATGLRDLSRLAKQGSIAAMPTLANPNTQRKVLELAKQQVAKAPQLGPGQIGKGRIATFDELFKGVGGQGPKVNPKQTPRGQPIGELPAIRPLPR